MKRLMRLRNIVLAAAVAVPLAWTSAPVSAQQRGLDRAAVATARADSVVDANNNSESRRPAEPPKGIVRRFGEGLANMLPPGIRRWFSSEPEPVPEPVPLPEPVPCRSRCPA
ncbi:MAG: hypothetical protein EXR91_11630 [Gemmatimonadetes bacterium]|nr:hypothetical protein [Gemmatimonadota bacterium]